MSLFKKMFSKSSKESDNQQKELLLKNIDEQISENKENVSKSMNEIEHIKKWIAEVIHDHFYVPGDFWYEELSHFDEIKANKENLSVDADVLHRSEELIKEYQSQIKFRETKIELSEMTIVKFEESKQKILDLDSKQITKLEVPEESDAFKKHQIRLNDLSHIPEGFNNEQNFEKQLENITENVNELIENHEIEEEVQLFMKKLNEQFNAEMKNYDQTRLISEMEKLIEQYKTRK